jgi:transcriptional regulator with XRE-family HTH domain
MDWDTDFTGAARLKRARNFQRMTLKQVAAAFGVSDNTVMRWESGDGAPGTHYRKAVDAFIQNAERIIASQLAPKARYSSPPVVWVRGRIADAV